MFEIFKLGKKKKELEEQIALLEQRLEDKKDDIECIKLDTELFTAERDRHRQEALEAQAVLDALNDKIHVIEEMQDYNIPYYQDSLDELEHKRYELQSQIESAVNTGLYRIEQGYTLNDSTRRGKEM